MVGKLIWEGYPSHFSVHSDGHEGIIRRDTGEWETIERFGKITKTRIYDEFLKGFQGDILVFDDNDYKICEIESTHEYYDYDAHFERVVKLEQTERGSLCITIRGSARSTNS